MAETQHVTRFDWIALLGKLLLLIVVVTFVLAILINSNGGPAPETTTKVVIRAVMGLAELYQKETSTIVDHRTNFTLMLRNARGATGMAVPESWNEWLIANLWRSAQCKSQMGNLGGNAVSDTDDNGFLEILDGWGNPLVYVSGVSHSDTFTWDDFLPEHPRPYLASPGPDGVFGNANNDPQGKAGVDDMYSFDFE